MGRDLIVVLTDGESTGPLLFVWKLTGRVLSRRKERSNPLSLQRHIEGRLLPHFFSREVSLAAKLAYRFFREQSPGIWFRLLDTSDWINWHWSWPSN
ncbi:hypothetical protein SUGI_1487360 [Cryptomeria japonica]|uniref:Uncharacterized protein n=1 Tax=Cryptomeria japonica TaxID=3369 RepID=A0AAD3RPQ9_CRYJA|nr:hypothetical protein SUGI_1463580 [Cryptomeria japonica]GLJ58987.1 hypothetical protein SUGI_1487360 [Cryptomeria japonica]